MVWHGHGHRKANPRLQSVRQSAAVLAEKYPVLAVMADICLLSTLLDDEFGGTTTCHKHYHRRRSRSGWSDLTGPLFRKILVGVTIITINTCVLVHAAAACSASG